MQPLSYIDSNQPIPTGKTYQAMPLDNSNQPIQSVDCVQHKMYQTMPLDNSNQPTQSVDCVQRKMYQAMPLDDSNQPIQSVDCVQHKMYQTMPLDNSNQPIQSVDGEQHKHTLATECSNPPQQNEGTGVDTTDELGNKPPKRNRRKPDILGSVARFAHYFRSKRKALGSHHV